MNDLKMQIVTHPAYKDMSALKQAAVWDLSSDADFYPRRADGLAISFANITDAHSPTEEYAQHAQIAHELLEEIQGKASPDLAKRIKEACDQHAQPKPIISQEAPDMALNGVHNE